MRDLMIKLLEALGSETSSNRQMVETKNVESVEVKKTSGRKEK